MKPLSFSAQKRLKKPEQFAELRRNGRTLKLHHFLVTFRANTQPTPRLGLSVSKKRAKRAVHRNLVKRAVRESFRVNQLDMPNTDFLVTLTSRVDNPKKIMDIKKQIPGIWQKVKALSAP